MSSVGMLQISAGNMPNADRAENLPPTSGGVSMWIANWPDSARVASGVPGSDMATKCDETSAMPRSAIAFRKTLSRDSGSTVVPDLLATANAADSRSRVSMAFEMVAGFTVSKTFRAGCESGKRWLRTSGVRLLPPIPRMLREVTSLNAVFRAVSAEIARLDNAPGRSSHPIQSPPPPGEGSGHNE